MLDKNQLIVAENQLFPIGKTFSKQDSQDDKLSIHPIIYCLNLLMMVSIPFFVLFFIFYDQQKLQTKGYLAIFLVFWCISIMIPTIINLKISISNLFKTLIILDSLLLSTSLLSLAFVGMMYFLDQGQWEIKILQLSFCVSAVTKIINVRLLLLFMKWKPIQVICFKLGIVVMALTYFNIGVYCLYTNFSYTYNILIGFDQQVRYFIVLFTFTGFDFMSNLLKIICAFDYSDTLRDAYVIKNVNPRIIAKRQKIMKSFKRIPDQRKKKQALYHLVPVVKINSNKNRIQRV